MSDKVYLDANGVTRDSFLLARQIYDSGFKPDIIIALWRGGTPVGIVVHEFLHYKGSNCYHTVVKTSSYTGIAQQGEPVVENIDYVLARLNSQSNVLVVDDIFDSGNTAKIIKRIITRVTPNLKFATLYFKPLRNKTDFSPDYFVAETDSWLVFPHELVGLSPSEILEKDSQVHALLGLS